MFIFPLEGENPTRHTHYILWTIILICIGFFIATLIHGRYETLNTLGYIPATSTDITTILISMFLHGSYWHLLGNMFFLWMFGDNIEDVLGQFLFLACYLLCGIVATMTYAGLHGDSTVPLIGASGAISGIAGMYIAFFPKVSAELVIYFLYWEINRIKTTIFVAIGGWFLLQVLLGMLIETNNVGNYIRIAFSAHVGGFIIGLLLGFIFVKMGYVERYMGSGKKHWLLGYAT